MAVYQRGGNWYISPRHKTRVVNVLDRVMAQNPPQEERVVAKWR